MDRVEGGMGTFVGNEMGSSYLFLTYLSVRLGGMVGKVGTQYGGMKESTGPNPAKILHAIYLKAL